MSRATVHIQIGRHLNMWANLFFLGEGGIRPHPPSLPWGGSATPRPRTLLRGHQFKIAESQIWGSGEAEPSPRHIGGA